MCLINGSDTVMYFKRLCPKSSSFNFVSRKNRGKQQSHCHNRDTGRSYFPKFLLLIFRVHFIHSKTIDFILKILKSFNISIIPQLDSFASKNDNIFTDLLSVLEALRPGMSKNRFSSCHCISFCSYQASFQNTLAHLQSL